MIISADKSEVEKAVKEFNLQIINRCDGIDMTLCDDLIIDFAEFCEKLGL